jgi:hypothetical protein
MWSSMASAICGPAPSFAILSKGVRYTVLVPHSYELFAVLGAIAWWTHAPLLFAYLAGALLHLALDIIFNGRITPYSIAAFYSFTYRLVHRFDAHGRILARVLQGRAVLEGPHAVRAGRRVARPRRSPSRRRVLDRLRAAGCHHFPRR